MKRKTLLLCYFIIIMLCACSKENDLKNLTVREKNDPLINRQTNIEKEPIEDNQQELKNQQHEKEIVKEDESKTETKPTISISEEKPSEPHEEDDSVDETSIDYKIHKGRIDCLDESSCMDISLPIQFAFKDNISNAFYLEVISKSDKLLGYFIEYVFIDKTYSNNEECIEHGDKIYETLSSRIISYECIDNTLKINPDY